MKIILPALAAAFVSLAAAALANEVPTTPHLQKHGSATQLMVDGKPFLILGGELHNSSSSSLDCMKPIWPGLAALHLNTVLTPVSWELIATEEGKFDFILVDSLIHGARQNHLHLVFTGSAVGKTACPAMHRYGSRPISCAFPGRTGDGEGREILPLQRGEPERRCACVYRVDAAYPRGGRAAGHDHYGPGGRRDRHDSRGARPFSHCERTFRPAGAAGIDGLS